MSKWVKKMEDMMMTMKNKCAYTYIKEAATSQGYLYPLTANNVSHIDLRKREK